MSAVTPSPTPITGVGSEASSTLNTADANNAAKAPHVLVVDPTTSLPAQSKGAKTLTTPATSTTAASVLAANTSRKLAVLTNPQSNAATIYVGPASMTSSAYTAALTPGASWVDGDSSDAWYAASSAGTPTLAVTEIA